jgi:hypothetical protein
MKARLIWADNLIIKCKDGLGVKTYADVGGRGSDGGRGGTAAPANSSKVSITIQLLRNTKSCLEIPIIFKVKKCVSGIAFLHI